MAEMTIRAATPADIDMIHAELMDVIATSPHYNDQFKAHEMGRLNKNFLRTLLALDPWHIMLMCTDGIPGGVMLSGPEYGVVFRYWGWVFPAFRRTSLGMFGMRMFDAHWDNGRFHKSCAYVRPDNAVALALLRRFGYRDVCVLEQHIFGQDYVLLEKGYSKVSEGYDGGVNIGRLGRLRQRLGTLVGA